ncbi:MAG: DEAD/DEAH box helicase, partial [Planctomycetota bacterium]|nr:DEAD/DEAH box helicase [Planctomycetota bacterium]
MQSKPSSPKLSASHSLADALRVDRFRLSRIRKRISQESFEQQVFESAEKKRLRESIQPRLEYSEELPITQYRQELIQKIRDHQIIIVCGETGSGKSTQLPKFCLEAGLGRDGVIGHTQPRRLAARSIASRLAEEVGGKVGEVIGYKVRFGDQTGGKTLIKLMTDGILLAETQRDRYLNQYDALIIDEAHERSLNIDFILGYLKNLQHKRPDLKIIITSATIDAERFSEHFSTGEEI